MGSWSVSDWAFPAVQSTLQMDSHRLVQFAGDSGLAFGCILLWCGIGNPRRAVWLLPEAAPRKATRGDWPIGLDAISMSVPRGHVLWLSQLSEGLIYAHLPVH